MRSSFKRYLILALGLCLPFVGIDNDNSQLKAQQKRDKTSIENVKVKLDNLLKNRDWVFISNYWKKLNNLERNNDFNVNYNKLSSLNSDINKVKKSILSLKNAKLLNEKESEFLQTFFQERLSYLEFALGTVKCYDMSQMGSKIAQTRGDLETRYDVLQKLFEENKINTDTFHQTRKKIVEDISFIDENSYYEENKKTSGELIDLIIYINK